MTAKAKKITKKKSKKSVQSKAAQPKVSAAADEPTTAPLLPVAMPSWSERFHTRLFSDRFARWYAWFALVVLGVSTAWWSWLSAGVHQSNADQIVNAYLFADSATWQGAILPATHSFLLKWPLFVLLKWFGFSAVAFSTITMAIVLLSVGGLVAILYRINRRPLVFGTICLALASCLLAIPAQPYAGGILPVNLAMIATRNLEYLWFIGCLILLGRTKRLRTWRFAVATVGLALLIVSDRLFLTLSVGGALLGLLVWALAQRWQLVSLYARWLMSSFLAGVGAVLLIMIINAQGAVRLAHENNVSPYGVIHSVHDGMIAGAYMGLGLLTNFGANPAAGTTVLRQMPAAAFDRLTDFGGLNIIVNGLIACIGLIAVAYVIRTNLRQTPTEASVSTIDGTISMLVAASLAATGAFLLTQHDYAVDARYLTIAVFAVFMAIAAWSRTRNWSTGRLLLIGAVVTLGMIGAVVGVVQTTNHEHSALAEVNGRNSSVVQAVTHHPVDTLVGDYWRVLPARFASPGHRQFEVLPLNSCSQARDVLTSQAWQPNLHKHSFAYLLSLDSSLTDYPHCSLEQVIAAYGAPDATTLIDGSLDQPNELLLFYDNGIAARPAKNIVAATVQTVLPIPPQDLPDPICDGPTIMNIVAHQDDDLLFINPDVAHDIKGGRCVRTIYLTAGDAGSGKYYMLNREQGSEAAYSVMLGQDENWVQRVVKLGDKQFVTVASPRDNPKVSLIFMHLPDGNLRGDGFGATHHESLARLQDGKIEHINSIDGQSTYTSDSLTHALMRLMQVYQPAEIRTQSGYMDATYPDHSDHAHAGLYATNAAARYQHAQFEDLVRIPLTYYIGYPVHGMADNVVDQDLSDTLAAFLAYARHDGSVCQTEIQCFETPTYNAYLKTQYLFAQ